MADDLVLSDNLSKAEKYEELLPQIAALIDGETDLIANLANVAAALKEGLGFFWVGFYLAKADELILGPFQGSVACTRIKRGRGVCGTAFAQMQTIVVPDVDSFAGHIACSSLSRSEIVVPVIRGGKVLMVLDVDSKSLNDFDGVDQKYLEQVAAMIDASSLDL